jgi:Holliday junction resolvase-like predicted endonuclease
MNRSLEEPTQLNLYDRLYEGLIESAESAKAAVEVVVEAYLDGKPSNRGKKKIKQAERDAAFWSSGFVNTVPVELWRSDILTLALTRYLRQERVANMELLGRIALLAPDAVSRAVRHSGLVLLPHSPRRAELDQIAGSTPEIAELCRILDIFDQAHRERVAAVDKWKAALKELSPVDLLIYASLYAFEHLVPRRFDIPTLAEGADSWMQEAWDVINDLLIWKLKTFVASVNLKEADIGPSLAKHLSPFLFPSPSGQVPRHDLLAAFGTLIGAQNELNSFISQSTDAFSYDDGIRFVRREERLEIEEVDPAARAAWRRNGRKLARLHRYWFYRALDEFVSSDMAAQLIGRPENHEANRLAYIRAMRTQLQLTEVYGVDEMVITDSGARVNLFQALLSLELMSAFFQRDFLERFVQNLMESGHWVTALGRLAFDGLVDGNQNRFPLTWSDREDKIANIIGWTVNADSPQGNPLIAAAILDFWTSDWVALSERLRKGESGLHSELFERPILKLGNLLIQLPWLVGLQNNSTASINNLRRLGARRGEAGSETRRIEERLGKLFEAQGFRVALNWHPPAESYPNAGEVDLICARDGIVLVTEVKSTFLRSSQRDAWLHATTTLRKAGQQISRKVSAVRRALAEEVELASSLGIDNLAAPLTMHGWIVDTSIEHDHQRFGGFLKVSLEEVLIALRDDRHLLNDPDGIISGRHPDIESEKMNDARQQMTLYPEGFSAARFIEVIENESVWDEKVIAQAVD